jgi:mono/diheme cytochrome c family protein
MKNFVLGMLTATLLLAVGGAIFLRLGFAEVRGDLRPSSFETKLMTAAVHAAVGREAPEVPNPVPPTDENLIAGGKLFSANCGGCHGNLGSQTDDGDALFPPAPQLHQAGTQYTEAQIFWIAKHGIRRTGMFANGRWSSDRDLWTTAAYVKRLGNLPPAVEKALAAKAPGAPN